ncbi:hypothetical protein D3C86_2111750 [compost metagenome]
MGRAYWRSGRRAMLMPRLRHAQEVLQQHHFKSRRQLGSAESSEVSCELSPEMHEHNVTGTQ